MVVGVEGEEQTMLLGAIDASSEMRKPREKATMKPARNLRSVGWREGATMEWK